MFLARPHFRCLAHQGFLSGYREPASLVEHEDVREPNPGAKWNSSARMQPTASESCRSSACAPDCSSRTRALSSLVCPDGQLAPKASGQIRSVNHKVCFTFTLPPYV